MHRRKRSQAGVRRGEYSCFSSGPLTSVSTMMRNTPRGGRCKSGRQVHTQQGVYNHRADAFFSAMPSLSTACRITTILPVMAVIPFCFGSPMYFIVAHPDTYFFPVCGHEKASFWIRPTTLHPVFPRSGESAFFFGTYQERDSIRYCNTALRGCQERADA